MKRLKKISVLLGSFVLAGMISCSGPSTSVTGTWENNMSEAEYNNIAVASFISDASTESVIERQIERHLEDEGVMVSTEAGIKADEIIQDDARKNDIMQNLQQEGKEAILTVSVVASDTETRYVPGTAVYDPINTYGYYGDFWGYYDYRYPQVYNPGYYSIDKVYYLETNLYDTQTEELVWSAQSETWNPEDLDNFADEFAEDIVEHLDESDIID